ncbi:hypothetical protein [Myxococcus sp. CA039A]|uniref:hypothetical protein n=1 Tax=Myxococcus sp. CA039A TaxID=2741737 RepID=UPI00157A656A|nr:hypothetical protein [Myxococcus sp. CA039A]NTX51411.1 hypothetical protein [Myxococcus sp. CA039A]
MHHGTSTVITRVLQGKREALDDLLSSAANARRELFAGVPGLHFARWALIDLGPRTSGMGPADPRLIFGADAVLDTRATKPDALDRELLHALVRWLTTLHERGADAAHLFDAIYRNCAGYPEAGLAEPEAVEDYLVGHRAPAVTRHVDFAYRFQSPEDLRASVDALRAVNTHLDTRAPLLAETPWRGRPRDMPDLHHELRDVARAAATNLDDPGWRERLATARESAAVATLGYAFYRYAWALPGIYLLKLRMWLGARNRPESATSSQAHASESAPPIPPMSDAMVQNPMVHVARIVDDPGALALARLALRSVNLRLRRYVVGLNHVQTIHCARWLVYSDEDGRGPHHLIFFSNYDDTWESYIDAFVDHADVRGFLELIWSRTEGFPAKSRGIDPTMPKPRLPVEPFKAWLRAHEVPTRVWYSAALDGTPRQRHSVLLLHNALRLRELLTRERMDQPVKDRGARRALAAFLSRGACDPGRPLLRPMAIVIHSMSALLTSLRHGRREPRRKHHANFRAEPSHVAPMEHAPA